jgi:ankyrin repeat protein
MSSLTNTFSNVNAIYNDGQIALMKAVFNGDADMVQLLLARGANVNATDDEEGQTALMDPVDNGDADMVQLLLARGANVNAINNSGSTALMKAASNGDADMVQLLLARGADVNATDNDGQTALMKACVSSQVSRNPRKKSKGKKKRKRSSQVYPEGPDRVDIVQLLLARGADVNATDNYGQTALMVASMNGEADIAQLLIARGANVDATDEYDGETAFMMAAYNGEADMVQLLLDRGADVNATDNEGQTALMKAEQCDMTVMAQLLIARGAKGGKDALDVLLRRAGVDAGDPWRHRPRKRSREKSWAWVESKSKRRKKRHQFLPGGMKSRKSRKSRKSVIEDRKLKEVLKKLLNKAEKDVKAEKAEIRRRCGREYACETEGCGYEGTFAEVEAHEQGCVAPRRALGIANTTKGLLWPYLQPREKLDLYRTLESI